MEKQLLDGGNDSVLHRRILFHPAQNKTENGCRPDNFYLEPLNPQPELCSSETGIAESTVPRPTISKNHRQEDLDSLDAELTEEFEVRRIGAGLTNLGNTCFLNSVLQCLTYTQPLAAYFQSGRHKWTCRVAGFCAMCAVQDHAISALGSSGKIVSPVTLVRNLRSISRNFQMSRQEDAHEYMVNLMEAMHKCCLPAGVKSESPVAYEKSLMHKIFGGQLISQVKCMQCSYCSNTFDPFLDLSLEIIRADSLLKALSHYTALDQLDGGEKRYQCERCKAKVKALKQLKIDKAPYILAIHLKRFSTGGTGGKIDKKVDFGCTLDLKPFVSSSMEGDMRYTLYGVLVHAGWSTHSGHYYCFIRTSTGIWHALDDSRVYQVSEKSVLSQKAYMLFYTRDKGNSMKQPYGPQSKDNGSKVNETASLKIRCAMENGLQDSCAPQMTAKLHPNLVDAASAMTTCNLVKQGNQSIRTDAMVSCNEIQVKHSKNSVVSNDNGHFTGMNPGDDSTNNGIRHSEADLNDLSAKRGGHKGVEHSNVSNSNYEALRHPENGDRASISKDNEHQSVKHLSPRDGSGFQDGGNVTLAYKASGANSSSLKTNQPDKISTLMKESGSVSKKHHKNLKDSNHPISRKTLKLMKHLEHSNFLKIFPFTRYFLLKSMSIVRNGRSNERKKRMKLHLNNHGILLKRKHSAGTKRSGHSIASKKAVEQPCEKDSSNKQYNLKQQSKTTEMTIGVAENGCGHDKFEQGNDVTSPLKRRKFSSGNSNGFKKERKIVEQNFTNVDQCSNSMEELLSPAQPKNVVKMPNCTGLNKEKTVFIDQSNCNSTDGGKTSKERAVSFKNSGTSSLESKLHAAAVPCWDGVDDDWVKKNRAWDRQSVRVGYVLDEWDEEYDRGKRKKVKQTQDGTDDLSGGYSDGQRNPFQQLANSKAKIHNTIGKSFKRSNQMEI